MENPDIRDVIELCISQNKDERPSMKQLLQLEFFAEDTGFKLEICERERAVDADELNSISFRLRFTDQRKQRRDKPAHKENEAIEYEFNLEQDNSAELSSNMFDIGLLVTEEDAKRVSKMMEAQILQLKKEREEKRARIAAEQQQQQLLLQQQQEAEMKQQQEQQMQQQMYGQQQQQQNFVQANPMGAGDAMPADAAAAMVGIMQQQQQQRKIFIIIFMSI